jgi:hypothetical protein
MPVPSGSSTPSGSASPSASAFPVDGDLIGDVMTADTVTDNLGNYLHVTISPLSDAFTAVDPATVDGSITGSDWDDEELLDGQRFVARFVAEQTMDSIALDRDKAGWSEWLKSVAPDYFADPLPSALNQPADNTDRALPIFNDADNMTPELIRDGGARLSDATISIDSLANDPREGGEWLTVDGTASAAYRLSDESAIASLVAQGYTADEAVAEFPALADGEEGSYLVEFTFEYEVDRVAGKWVIRAWSLTSDASIEGVNQA